MYALTRTALAAVMAASLLALTPPTAQAGPIIMPLVSSWRACDFSRLTWVGSYGYGDGIVHLTSTGSTITADFDLATGQPNTRYDVRVIQTPRPSIGCAPGAPGVIAGTLQTDGVGTGSTTLTGPIESSATGAWVILQRPAPFSQTSAEFYTSTFIATI